MPDLDERFRALRTVRTPDLWKDIQVREPSHRGPSPRRWPAAVVAFAVAVAGLTFAVSTFLGGRSTPSTPVTNDLIAFSGFDGTSWQIYSIESDGSDLVQLTHFSDSLVVIDPSWSPDGKRLAFVVQSARDPSEGGDFDLYVMNADGSGLTRLTTDGLSLEPSWSPDGTRIVYSRLSVGGTSEQVWIMNGDGSDAHPFTNCGPPECLGDSSPAWSPDGDRIAFVRVSGAGAVVPVSVMVWPVDLSAPPKLEGISLEDATWASDLAWSPDGSELAFARSFADGERFGLTAMGTDGTDQRSLTDVASAQAPAWSPDGRRIAFMAPRSGTDQETLYVMNADGSDVHQVPGLPVEAASPSWQPVTSVSPTPTPGTGSVSTRTATTDVAPHPSAVAVGESGVWVTSCCSDGSGRGEVMRLDPATGDVVARIPIEAAPGWDFGGAGLAVGDGSVWTVGAFRGESGCCDELVTRIDPATNAVVDEFPVPGMTEGDVWVDGSTLYVLGFTAEGRGSSTPLQLAKVDATSHAIAWQVSVPGQWSQTVFVSGGSVWVVGTTPDAHGPIEVTMLYRIDRASGDVLDQIPLPGSVYMPVVYPDAIWIRVQKGVQTVDPVSGQIGEPIRPGPGCCVGPFVPDGEGGVWVVSSAGAEVGRSIWHIDAEGTVVAFGTIEDRQAFDEMQGQSYAFDPATQTIWSQHYGDSVSRIELTEASASS